MAEECSQPVCESVPEVIWKKSSYSGYNGECVEVANSGSGLVQVRDSKAAPGGPVLQFAQPDWAGFLAWVRRSRGA